MTDRENPTDVIAQHIRKYGWHCLHVHPTEGDDEALKFSYSIGFTESFSQPEILIFGLSRDKAHALLSECASLLSSGTAFEPDVEDDRVLDNGYKVVFRPVLASRFGEYLGTARRYFGARSFSAIVMYLPDREGKFPWQSDYAGMDVDEALSITGPPEAGRA